MTDAQGGAAGEACACGETCSCGSTCACGADTVAVDAPVAMAATGETCACTPGAFPGAEQVRGADHVRGAATAASGPGVQLLGMPTVPRRASDAAAPEHPAGPVAGRHTIEQCAVPPQTFTMGDPFGEGKPLDGEGHLHEVELDAFEIDATSVTNAAFARFVEATGYRTEAETFGFSAVFHLAVDAPRDDVMGPAAGTPWWWGVKGADWRHPGGRSTGIAGLEEHPAVHISWNDAVAYCEWAGRRLPTEAEWECASRGGLAGARYPWGDELMDAAGGWRCNIWQGEFPARNTRADGFLLTAPVRTFEPNAYGLWQTVGNVWEWCADLFDRAYYERSPRHNPAGPERGGARVLRGGSYLCHDSYCNRYRNAARSSNTADSSMGNAGFRTVAL